MTELAGLYAENAVLDKEITSLLLGLCHTQAEVDRHRADVVFLLQALLAVKDVHPDLDLPDLQNRFDKGIWARAVVG